MKKENNKLIKIIKKIWKKVLVIPISINGFIQKDFSLLLRKKKYLYLSILLPLLIGIIYLFTLNGSSSTIKVMICDMDGSSLSSGNLLNPEYYYIIKSSDVDCIKKMKLGVLNRDYLFGIVIPEGFNKQLEDLQQSSLDIYYDNSDPSIANFASWKIDIGLMPLKKKVIVKLSDELKKKSSSAHKKINIALELTDYLGNDKLSEQLKNNILSTDDDLKKLESMDTNFLVNPIITNKKGIHEKRKMIDLGLAPLFVVLNLFLLLMLCSTSIIYDRKNGLFSRIKASNSTIFNYLFAKIIFFSIITIMQFILLILLFIAFGASFNISIGFLLFALIFISILNTTIGFLIGLVSESEGLAVLISLIITLPMMFLSSMFFPLEIMPKIIQWFAKLLPLHTELLFMKSALFFGGVINWNYLLIPLSLFFISWWFTKK